MDLPETEQKRIAIQAGILDIESVLDEAIDREENWIDPDSGHYYEESELSDYGYTHESEINCQDNFELVLEALGDLNLADSDDQERLIEKVLKKQDAISEKVRENLGKEYVQYDATDTGYMLTKYDSNVATKWKKGANTLPLPTVGKRVTAVIKDVPFKVIERTCNID